MDAEKSPAQKRSGPKARIISPERFNTTLPSHHRRVLETYSDQESISLAAALRAAIDLLEKNVTISKKVFDMPE